MLIMIRPIHGAPEKPRRCGLLCFVKLMKEFIDRESERDEQSPGLRPSHHPPLVAATKILGRVAKRGPR